MEAEMIDVLRDVNPAYRSISKVVRAELGLSGTSYPIFIDRTARD